MISDFIDFRGFILIAPSRFGSEEQVCVSLINSSSSEKLSVTLLEHKSDAIITSAHVDITGKFAYLKSMVLTVPFFRHLSLSYSSNTSAYIC